MTETLINPNLPENLYPGYLNSGSINSTSIAPQTPIQVPQIPPASTGEGLNASIPTPQSIIDQSTTPTVTDTQQSQILNRLATLTGEQKSLTTRQTEAETAAGVPAFSATLRSLSTQLQGYNDQSSKLQLDASAGGTIQNQLQNDSAGRGITAGGLAPIQTAALRNNQIQQASIAGQALTTKAALYAAQNDYSNAKDAADKAAQVIFDAGTQEINHQKALLDAIAPTLNREEKVRAVLLQTQLNDRQKQIDSQREDFKKGQAMAITAMSLNPSDTKAQFASQQALKLDPKDPQYLQKVSNLVGKYQQDPQELAYKRAQIASLNATAAQKSAGGGIGAAVSPELQQAITDGTIDPNKINSRTLGIYNELAKGQVNTVSAHAGVTANTKSYQDAITYMNLAKRTTSVLDKNMPLIFDLADKVNQLGVPGVDDYIRGIKAYTGNNQDVIRYVNTIKTLRAEYANMLAKGNQVTDSVRNEAAEAVPTGLSSDGYRALASQLKLETSNIISAAQETANSIYDRSKSSDTSTLPPEVDTALSANAITNNTNKTVTIPRSVWSKYPAQMDAIKAGIEAKGYSLLIQ